MLIYLYKIDLKNSNCSIPTIQQIYIDQYQLS